MKGRNPIAAVLEFQFEHYGKVQYKGLSYKNGVNEVGFNALIDTLDNSEFTDEKLTVTILELASLFDDIVYDWRDICEGFTIGRGKQLHWYMNPCPKTGKYKCHPQYEHDGKYNSDVGKPSYHYTDKPVTVHYKHPTP